MNCLLIEDNISKADQVGKFIQGVLEPEAFFIARSYQSGLKYLEEHLVHLILLDMTLPNFDVAPGVRSGKPRPLGGYDLLRKIKRKKLASKVIVVTQFERFGTGYEQFSFSELKQKCAEEFPGNFLDAVQFSLSDSKWQSELHKIVSAI